ncbi:hypothetical protein KI387_000825, partial [Taxus chinensis]
FQHPQQVSGFLKVPISKVSAGFPPVSVIDSECRVSPSFRHQKQVSGFAKVPTYQTCRVLRVFRHPPQRVGLFYSSGIFSRSGFSVWITSPEFQAFLPPTFFMSDPGPSQEKAEKSSRM